jgi:hypothetical protein
MLEFEAFLVPQVQLTLFSSSKATKGDTSSYQSLRNYRTIQRERKTDVNESIEAKEAFSFSSVHSFISFMADQRNLHSANHCLAKRVGLNSKG